MEFKVMEKPDMTEEELRYFNEHDFSEDFKEALANGTVHSCKESPDGGYARFLLLPPRGRRIPVLRDLFIPAAFGKSAL